VKGNQIKKLRTDLELSVMEFASLHGVQPSSVYRWEASGNRSAVMEGFARQIFMLLSALKLKERKRIVQKLRSYGWMAALHSLLGISMKKAA
jgi:DNA-binding transcriptional regulator YiaG